MRICLAIVCLVACSTSASRPPEPAAPPPSGPSGTPSVAAASATASGPSVTAGSVTSPSVTQNKPASGGPRLLVLGTFHMSSDGSDLLQVKAPDMTTPVRQRELDELVARLARFRPTKIALEAPFGDADTKDRYRRYLAGDYQARRNEIDQVGFRLAKAMKHAEVYPVDWRNPFDFAPVMASAAQSGQGALLQGAIAEARAYVAELQQQMERPVVDSFRFVNDLPRAAQLHQLYVRLVRIGKADDYAASDLLAGWFERNLKMTANLTRIADSPDDRVVFLVGSGHLHLVREFAAGSGAFALEAATDYLQPAR